jgi:hypothetical protein
MTPEQTDIALSYIERELKHARSEHSEPDLVDALAALRDHLKTQLSTSERRELLTELTEDNAAEGVYDAPHTPTTPESVGDVE